MRRRQRDVNVRARQKPAQTALAGSFFDFGIQHTRDAKRLCHYCAAARFGRGVLSQRQAKETGRFFFGALGIGSFFWRSQKLDRLADRVGRILKIKLLGESLSDYRLVRLL